MPARTDKGRRVTLLPAGTKQYRFPANVKPVLIGFFVALMGLIITLACMNLANMLIARGANRRKELAIRLAVGASRFRLDPADDERRHFALAAGRHGGIRARVWSLGVELPLHAAHGGAGRIRFQPGLARGRFRVRPCARVRHRIQPGARPASDESRRDPGAQRGLGAAVARLSALWSAQLADGGAGGGIAHAAADDRIPGIGNQQSKQHRKPNSIRTRCICCPSIRCATATRPKKRKLCSRNFPNGSRTAGPVRSVALAAQAPFSVEDEMTRIQLTAEGSRDHPHECSSPWSRKLSARAILPRSASRCWPAASSRSAINGTRQTDRRPSTLPVVLNETAERKLFGNENAIGKRVQRRQAVL